MKIVHSFSVIVVLYIGLPKSPGYLVPETSLSYKNVVTKHICIGWVSTGMDRWIGGICSIIYIYLNIIHRSRTGKKVR